MSQQEGAPQDQKPEGPEEGTSGVPLQEIAGWTGTVSIRRMQRAMSILNATGENEEIALPEDDPQAAQDAEMLYLSMTAAVYPTTLDQRLDCMPDDHTERLNAVIGIAKELDSEHTFGGVVFTRAEESPEMLELTHIMGLLRHHEWMGASTYLPTLKNTMVNVFESEIMRNRPGLIIAVPDLNPKSLSKEPLQRDILPRGRTVAATGHSPVARGSRLPVDTAERTRRRRYITARTRARAGTGAILKNSGTTKSSSIQRMETLAGSAGSNRARRSAWSVKNRNSMKPP